MIESLFSLLTSLQEKNKGIMNTAIIEILKFMRFILSEI